MTPASQERIQSWLSGPYDASVKSEILRLEKENPLDLADAFYRDLSFGTGGMRGIMGIGTNRMNIYTVRAATQGLSQYLLKTTKPPCSVFIGYDVRLNSRLFAEETARTLAGNGITVHLTEKICPTPLASFGCRYLGCSAAVMITASHNPPQYNGYKVFWSDGAQVVFPHDEGIIAEVRKVIKPDQVRLAPLDSPLIHSVKDDIDEAYLHTLDHPVFESTFPSLKIVYTNLHGTGLRLVPHALKRLGFRSIQLVKEQESLDGHFPSAPVPNPEEEAALHIGSKQLIEQKADLLLATDPDADRLGVVIRDQNRPVRLNGHQIACLSLFHIAATLHEKNKIPPSAAFIKTIVTTEMTRKIAEDFGIACFDVLTGFKYIGAKIREWETDNKPKFVFGAEESHGYLLNANVRDKDAISAACLISEAAGLAKEQNRTLIDVLFDLYRKYGVHRQSLTTLAFSDSQEGMEKIERLMKNLRQNPPSSIQNRKVVRLDDYLQKISITTKISPIDLPLSDVLSFWLDDQSRLIIRPSGTEPKVKIYSEVCDLPTKSVEKSILDCDARLKEIVDDFKQLI